MEPSWQWRNYSKRKLDFLKKLLKTETWLLEGNRSRGKLGFLKELLKIEKLGFFDKASFAKLFELDHDTRGFHELDFVDNTWFVKLFEFINDTKGIGEFDFFGNPQFG